VHAYVVTGGAPQSGPASGGDEALVAPQLQPTAHPLESNSRVQGGMQSQVAQCVELWATDPVDPEPLRLDPELLGADGVDMDVDVEPGSA
jgi:hypothetical protein